MPWWGWLIVGGISTIFFSFIAFLLIWTRLAKSIMNEGRDSNLRDRHFRSHNW